MSMPKFRSGDCRCKFVTGGRTDKDGQADKSADFLAIIVETLQRILVENFNAVGGRCSPHCRGAIVMVEPPFHQNESWNVPSSLPKNVSPKKKQQLS